MQSINVNKQDKYTCNVIKEPEIEFVWRLVRLGSFGQNYSFGKLDIFLQSRKYF